MDLCGVDLVGGNAEVDIAKYLRTIHPSGVFEIRSLNCPDRVGGTFKSTASGYFNDHAIAAKESARLDALKPSGIYCTTCVLQPIMLGRANNRIQFRAKETANDTHAIRRTNLFIDIDADKMAGVSSTDGEMRAALERMLRIKEQLDGLGWPAPILGMSGNGGSLMYRIDLEVTEDMRQLISRLYGRLGEICGTEVDKSVINASRLTKVLGTMARKGDELRGVEGLEDRIHRRSWYVLPASYDVLTLEQISDVAGDAASVLTSMATVHDACCEHDSSVFSEPALPSMSIKIPEWSEKYNVPLGPPSPWSGGPAKFPFLELPIFCQNSPSGHTDNVAFIYVHHSGAISAGCSHARCIWDWSTVRRHYEGTDYGARKAEPPTRSDLFIKPDGTHSAVPNEISKADEAAEKAANKAKEAADKATRSKKVLAELASFMESWRIERIMGDEHVYRLSGPFFYSESSSVAYLELEFDDLWSFNSFNTCLGKWRTGKNCVLPQLFEKVWKDAVGLLLNRAIDVEGHSETRITSYVADRLLYLIEVERRPLHAYANEDSRARFENEYKGVLIRQYLGETQYLIEFSRVLKTMQESYSRDIRRKHLIQTLDGCKSVMSYVNLIKKDFRVLNASNIELLRKIAYDGKLKHLEISPAEIPAPARRSKFDTSAIEDDLDSQFSGEDEFNFGANAV